MLVTRWQHVSLREYKEPTVPRFSVKNGECGKKKKKVYTIMLLLVFFFIWPEISFSTFSFDSRITNHKVILEFNYDIVSIVTAQLHGLVRQASFISEA